MDNTEQLTEEQARIIEHQQIQILIERGTYFDVEKKSLLRLLSEKKQWRFMIGQPYLGTLDFLAECFVQMRFDEKRIEADWLGESKQMMRANAKLCAKIVAISWLNSKWGIRFLLPAATNFFLWRVTPKKLLQLSHIIFQMSNLPDFTASIKLMSLDLRVTAPNLMEGKAPEAA